MNVSFNINIADLIPLIISFWALWIAYKNRRNAMRENLYNRQIDAFYEIIQKMDVLSIEIDKWLKNPNFSTYQVFHKYDTLDDAIEKHILILPDKLDIKLDKFLRLIEGVLNKNDRGFDNIIIINRYVDIEESFREYIGIEKLSKENRRLTK